MEISKLFYTSDRQAWREWLAAHFEDEADIWFVFPMKGSGEASLPYNDAVEEALCFGWIDSTIKHIDPLRRAQRFSPRRPGSTFSQPNIERLKKLDAQGLIHPRVRESLKDVISADFVFPEDIMDALRQDQAVWENYSRFSEPYKRIRIAYIEAARNRPDEFEKRLSSFIKKTKANKRIAGYGGIDRYY